MTTTTDVTIEDLTAERDRLTTLRDSQRPGSSDYWTQVAALAQVEAEIARRSIPELEQRAADAEVRVAEARPKVAALLAEYEAAKRAAALSPSLIGGS